MDRLLKEAESIKYVPLALSGTSFCSKGGIRNFAGPPAVLQTKSHYVGKLGGGKMMGDPHGGNNFVCGTENNFCRA